MAPSDVAGVGSAPPTPAKARIIAAALDLFARRGVGGTSLQMIADAIGVTKAAVYHQFQTKDEIVLAAAEAELALEAVLDTAEAEPSAAQAREVLLEQIVDLAVEHRRTVSIILSDPVIVGFFTDHERFERAMDRLCRLLMGEDAGPEARVQAAMLSAVISGAVIHPLVVGLDDDTLRAQLLLLTRRFLEGPPPAG